MARLHLYVGRSVRYVDAHLLVRAFTSVFFCLQATIVPGIGIWHAKAPDTSGLCYGPYRGCGYCKDGKVKHAGGGRAGLH
jgi:hypothetical protein